MIRYTSTRKRCTIYGGIAQLARAFGSYPTGRWFKSDFRYHFWPVGQAVKTRPFHGCNMGSIPVRVTKKKNRHESVCFSFYIILGNQIRQVVGAQKTYCKISFVVLKYIRKILKHHSGQVKLVLFGVSRRKNGTVSLKSKRRKRI